MKQEYLFFDKDLKEKLNSEYCIEGITKKNSDFGDDGSFVMSFSMSGETEGNAEKLSKLNDEIVSKYNLVILTNGSSAYFNKKLYPLYNDFERKLRRIIYITSNYYHVEEAKDVVADLETYVFGDIYDNIFTDELFVNDVKSIVNKAGKKNNMFSKTEIVNIINGYSESTIWEKLVGNSNLTIVSENFLKIKDYRNKVMHARSMNHYEYIDAKALIKKVNQEIDAEMAKYINKDESLAQIDIAGAIKGLIILAQALKVIKDEAKPVLDALTTMTNYYNGNNLRRSLEGLQYGRIEDKNTEIDAPESSG